MAKRGFFAELQHQNKLAAQRQARERRESVRAHAAALREAERAKKQAERAAAQAARASAAAQKEAEREAKRLREEAGHADAAARNAELAEIHDEFDSILTATLGVDDHVDLESLRVTVRHPPFPRKDLEVPTPPPPPIQRPVEPVFVEPERGTGLASMFGGSRKHQEAVARAQSSHADALTRWQAEVDAIPSRERADREAHAKVETRRLTALKIARDAYEDEAKQREVDAEAANRRLDLLIANLRRGKASAIEGYVGIVLGNSIYPEWLDVSHEFEFDLAHKELELTVSVATPECVPTVKSYRYVKASDAVVATDATKKVLKDRYANMLSQVAVRTLHEIFEADREGRIQTIALSVGTRGNDPATGHERLIKLLAVGADRDAFTRIDLANVVPEATLEHLNASISKNAFELIEIDSAPGVRG